MWALVESGTVKNTFSSFPEKLTISGRNYDKAELTAMSDSDKLSIGIYPVNEATKLNENYYISNSPSYAVSGNVVNETITKASDKKLDDEDAKDEGGNQLLDEDGSKIINYGLKTIAINRAKSTANGFLQGFRWLVERNVYDNSKAIPTVVKTYVAAIQKDADDIETAITNAGDMNAFIALHTDTLKGDGTVDVVARVNRWTSDKDVKQYRR